MVTHIHKLFRRAFNTKKIYKRQKRTWCSSIRRAQRSDCTSSRYRMCLSYSYCSKTLILWTAYFQLDSIKQQCVHFAARVSDRLDNATSSAERCNEFFSILWFESGQCRIIDNIRRETIEINNVLNKCLTHIIVGGIIDVYAYKISFDILSEIKQKQKIICSA